MWASGRFKTLHQRLIRCIKKEKSNEHAGFLELSQRAIEFIEKFE
jgi:hypothetical protein